MQLRFATSSWALLDREKMQKRVKISLPRSHLSSRRLLPFYLTSGVPCYLATEWILLVATVRGAFASWKGCGPSWMLVKLPGEGSQGSQFSDGFAMMASDLSLSNSSFLCGQNMMKAERIKSEKKRLVWIGKNPNPILPTQKAFIFFKLPNMLFFINVQGLHPVTSWTHRHQILSHFNKQIKF